MNKDRIIRIAASAGIFLGVVLLMCFAARLMMLDEKGGSSSEYDQALEKLSGTDTGSGTADDGSGLTGDETAAGETIVLKPGRTETDESSTASGDGSTGSGADSAASGAGSTDSAGSGTENDGSTGSGTDSAASGAGSTDSAGSGAESDGSTGSGADSAGSGAGSTGSAGSGAASTEGTDSAGSGTESASASGSVVSVSSKGHTVVINPDHQSKPDTALELIGPNAAETKYRMTYGATGVASGVPEYKLNLAIGLQLKTELEARGYSVYMIRETNDVQISEAERAQLANVNGDIVIHLHANSEERSEITGIMTFYPSSSNRFVSAALSSECKKLGKAILTGMEAATGARNWGTIAKDDLTELNWTSIPAAHVEVGYMSNADEDRLMQTADYQAKIVKGIADGIDLYFAE